MSKIESGQVNVSYLTLHRISVGLGVQIRELFPNGHDTNGKFTDGNGKLEAKSSDGKPTNGNL